MIIKGLIVFSYVLREEWESGSSIKNTKKIKKHQKSAKNWKIIFSLKTYIILDIGIFHQIKYWTVKSLKLIFHFEANLKCILFYFQATFYHLNPDDPYRADADHWLQLWFVS